MMISCLAAWAATTVLPAVDDISISPASIDRTDVTLPWMYRRLKLLPYLLK
jgi:hypothetical protein